MARSSTPNILPGATQMDGANTHKCEHCPAKFHKANQLRDHVALEHMPAGTKGYWCSHPGCGASFGVKQQLKAHERTHDRMSYLSSWGSPLLSYRTRWNDLCCVHVRRQVCVGRRLGIGRERCYGDTKCMVAGETDQEVEQHGRRQEGEGRRGITESRLESPACPAPGRDWPWGG